MFMVAFYPTEIHVEHETMVRPNWKELNLLFKGYFDWSASYNIHMSGSNGRYINGLKQSYNVSLSSVSDFDCMENTIGELVRYVFYKNASICQ